jgi:trans-aconitate methyltransferase
VDASLLERLKGSVEGGRALELGCGRGAGGEIILERFGAAQLELVDLDPDMVERARRRLAGRAGTRVSVGSAVTGPDRALSAFL